MMKLNFLKFALYSFLAIIMFACNNDEEVAPEEAEPSEIFAFDMQNPPIEVPSALQSSTNENAMVINTWLTNANAIASYGAYFQVPEGAVFSTTPISTSGSNNRIASSATVRVYTWTYSDGAQTFTTAYQLTEDANDYIFEIFYDFGDGFFKLLEGRESKAELMQGSLKWFGFIENEEFLSYQWEESSNGNFEFNIIIDSSTIQILANADGSGEINSFSDNVLNANYSWNAAGTSGTYTLYDEEGNIVETFNWTA